MRLLVDEIEQRHTILGDDDDEFNEEIELDRMRRDGWWTIDVAAWNSEKRM